MTNEFTGKKILVTGGTGSIGSAIVKRLLELNARQIRILSRDETKQYNLINELNHDKRIRLLIGDVRDKNRLNQAMENIDIVFHAAAMKHIWACENDPCEAVQTNVIGAQNVIDCALANNVKKVVGISTDKATDPVSVMGCTKLLAEKVMLAHFKGPHPTKFSFVRFGNVLNSRGSVVPLFYKQIKAGGPVTVTSKEIRRFFISINDAVGLVFKAAGLMQDREIFVLKNMAIVKIIDLARAMIELYAPQFGYDPKRIKIEITGLKNGERLQEKLLSKDESYYALENQEMFIILPVGHFTGLTKNILSKYGLPRVDKIGDYSTDGKKVLSVDKIKGILSQEKASLAETMNNFY